MIAPVVAALLTLHAGAAADEDDDEVRWEEPRPHLQLAGFGGASIFTTQGAETRGWYGAEAGWLFAQSTLSVMFENHRYGKVLADRVWTPVMLLRWEQRFETRPGVEAGLTLGFGAGRPSRSWIFWYQLAVVGRLVRGPWFLSGEFGLERSDILRLGAGVGARF